MTQHIAHAQQGHRYAMLGDHVLAMQSGPVVTVRKIDQSEPYPLGAAVRVNASLLKPLPMVYFHGEIPK